jgi:tRNAThr (cytosine32-N3)-methyltransferase
MQAGPKRVVEIGCGNGSTLFPLLAANENPLLDLHGYDYAKEAVAVCQVRFPSFSLLFPPC